MKPHLCGSRHREHVDTLRRFAQQILESCNSLGDENDDQDDENKKATNTSKILLAKVRGGSGMGKTMICRQLIQELQQQQEEQQCNQQQLVSAKAIEPPASMASTTTSAKTMIVLKGKCEQLQSFTSPYAAIVAALKQLLKRMPNKAIQKAFQEEGPILEAILSSSSDISDDEEKRDSIIRADDDEDQKSNQPTQQPSVGEDTMAMAPERFALSVQRLFSQVQQPILFFIDDLQWADEASLAFLQALISNAGDDIHLMLLLAYRDFFVPPDGLARPRNCEEEATIQVDPFDQKAIREVMEDWLVSHGLADNCNDGEAFNESLVNLVLERTSGNPLHCHQLMEFMINKEILTRIDDEWCLPHNSLPAESPAADVFLDQQLQSPPVRFGLQIAACVGSIIAVDLWQVLFEHIVAGKNVNIDPSQVSFDVVVEQAIAKELMQFNNDHDWGEENQPQPHQQQEQQQQQQQQEQQERQCSFLHDSIQQTVYESIPGEGQRDELHYQIGRVLASLLEKEQTLLHHGNGIKKRNSNLLFLAGDQLSRGAAHVVNDRREILNIVEILLAASKAAKRELAVGLQGDFLTRTIELVESQNSNDSLWDSTTHSMMIELYCLSAEAEFARGNFALSRRRVKMVLANSKKDKEQVRARIVRMEMLGAERHFAAAFEEAKQALELLGESLPLAGKLSFFTELARVKSMLFYRRQILGDGNLEKLPDVTDVRVIRAMKIMQNCCVYGWNSDPAYGAICFLRLMRLTMVYGQTTYLPMAISFYAIIIAQLGNENEAFRLSQLAMKYTNENTIAGTYLLVNVFLAHLRLPLARGLDPLLDGYRAGLRVGDIFFGSICLCARADLFMIHGFPLSNAVKDLRRYGRELKLCRQDLALSFILPWYQMALNLTGATRDPVTVSWEACREHELFRDNVSLDDSSPPGIYLLYVQLLNALIMKDSRTCRIAFERLLKLKNRRLGETHFANAFFVTLDGLAGLYLCRKNATSKTDGRKYLAIVNSSIAELVKISRRSNNGNWVGQLQLLQAERMALMGKRAGAITLFNKSISSLARQGFTHFGAIANELAAETMNRAGDKYWAKHYYRSSLASYTIWAAQAKIQHMKRTCSDSDIFESSASQEFRTKNVSIQGQERFDPMLDSQEIWLKSPPSVQLEVGPS